MCIRPPTTSMRGMLERLGSLSAASPRRTLVIVLAFVMVAAVLGGPVAGRLQSDGGFAPRASESGRADEQLARATGEAPSPALVAVVRGGDPQPVADRLAALPGVAHA